MTARSSRARIAIPIALILLAAGVRLWRLAEPRQLVWDEHYYVFDAEVYLGGGIGQPIPGAPPVKIIDEGTGVHRFPSVVFGIARVALLYLLALTLWGSPWWAGLAALLLSLDGLHIVQSRIAMLDIFLTTFITAGMLLLVMDRKRMDARDDRVEHLGFIERVFGSPRFFRPPGFLPGTGVGGDRESQRSARSPLRSFSSRASST